MKKLMITAAAAVCATVGFAALESANVVGYDQTGLRFGNKGAGASFVPVSGSTIDLQDLKVTGYDAAEGSDGDVTIMELDAFGRSTAAKTYTWIDAEDGGDVFFGWYDDAGDLVESVTFAPGEGLYVNAPSTDFSLQSAGQVPTSDITVQLRFGNKHCVNPTPVALDIQDIWISGYAKADGSDGDVMAMELDAFGRSTAAKTYTWIDAEDGGDVFFGWYNDAGDLVEDVSLGSGASFYFNAPSTDFYVNFPGVTL